MSTESPTNFREIKAFIKKISGQDKFIGAPRIYVDLFEGDIVSAVWFNQVVFHDGNNDEAIGFHKTAEEWKKELGLSPFQIRRSSKICQERGLVNIMFKKYLGTPKNHYLVVWPELIKQITELLRDSDLQQSERSDLQQSERSDLQEDKTSELQVSSSSMDIQQSEESLNQEENPSENQEEEEERIILPEIDSDPQSLLENLDLIFDPLRFGKLAIRKQYLEKSPAFILGWITKAQLDRLRLRDPIAFIVSRLKGTKDPELFYLENYREALPDEYLEKLGLALYVCPECKQEFKLRDELSIHWEENHETEEAEHLYGSPAESSDASRVWESIKESLRGYIPRESFESWVEATRAVSMGDGSLRIWTRNSFARDWLKDRLASTVDRLLTGYVPDESISVEFITGGGND